jgi:hypothetical protein
LAKFKQKAIERAREFDIHRILPLYEKIYESVLETV